MPIIVTGGAGFIGANLVKALNAQGRTDIWVVDNLNNEYRTMTIADCEVEQIMHWTEFSEMLACSSKMPKDISILHQGACSDTMETDAQRMLEDNCGFSSELLVAALTRGWPIVYASSAAVYGHHVNAVCEDPVFENPLNIYGVSKLMTDRITRIMQERGGSTIVGLRYFNVYGTREGLKGRMASMPYQMWHQLVRTRRIQLFEESETFSRDFVSVEDVVKVNLHFLFGPDKRGIFNCGSGVGSSFVAVAETLISTQGGDGEIEYIPFPDELRGVYQTFTLADLTALRAAGYMDDFIPMDEGVTKMAKTLSAGRL